MKKHIDTRGTKTKVADPTPDEIRKRANAIKEKNLEEKRLDGNPNLERSGGIRCYSYTRGHFTKVSLLS